MKRTARILAPLLLIMSICVVATAQISPKPSPANPSPAASSAQLTPDQVIRLLLDQQNELREIHEATKKERDEAVATLETEKKYSASVDRSYAQAEITIARLNTALDHYTKAIELHEKTIQLVEKQRDDAKNEAKRSKKIAKLSTIATAAMIGAKMLGIF